MPLYELGNYFTMMLSQFLLQISKNERKFSLCDYSVVKGQQIVLKWSTELPMLLQYFNLTSIFN